MEALQKAKEKHGSYHADSLESMPEHCVKEEAGIGYMGFAGECNQMPCSYSDIEELMFESPKFFLQYMQFISVNIKIEKLNHIISLETAAVYTPV